jgi:hypothetical protein
MGIDSRPAKTGGTSSEATGWSGPSAIMDRRKIRGRPSIIKQPVMIVTWRRPALSNPSGDSAQCRKVPIMTVGYDRLACDPSPPRGSWTWTREQPHTISAGRESSGQDPRDFTGVAASAAGYGDNFGEVAPILSGGCRMVR